MESNNELNILQFLEKKNVHNLKNINIESVDKITCIAKTILANLIFSGVKKFIVKRKNIYNGGIKTEGTCRPSKE